MHLRWQAKATTPGLPVCDNRGTSQGHHAWLHRREPPSKRILIRDQRGPGLNIRVRVLMWGKATFAQGLQATSRTPEAFAAQGDLAVTADAVDDFPPSAT